MILSRGRDGIPVLGSPGVGFYGGQPRQGEGLTAGSRAGTLVIMGRAIDLLVPEGAEGEVGEVHVRDAKTPVAYAEPLISIVPHSKAAARALRTKGSSSPRSKDSGRSSAVSTNPVSGSPSTGRLDEAALPAGAYALRAPTTGIFYARPDPDSPPYITEGALLETGQTAGLIEVMKCFSPIVHPGGSLPSPALVEATMVREGEVVGPGQILFLLRRP